MGIAILSGVVASLDARNAHTSGSPNGSQIFSPQSSKLPKWESHTSGTSTPLAAPDTVASLPSRFIACVSREESVRHLMRTFHGRGNLSETVEIVAGENTASVGEADVVLLWFVKQKRCSLHFH